MSGRTMMNIFRFLDDVANIAITATSIVFVCEVIMALEILLQ